jgi:hypothetical protein
MKTNHFYHLKESQVKNYDFIVYTIKGENVLNHLSEIEKEIETKAQMRAQFLVLFDTLLYSNNTEERFLCAQYKKNKFDMGSFKFVYISKKDKIRKQSLDFFKSNIRYVEKSTLLNSVQKKIILKGLPI